MSRREERLTLERLLDGVRIDDLLSQRSEGEVRSLGEVDEFGDRRFVDRSAQDRP